METQENSDKTDLDTSRYLTVDFIAEASYQHEYKHLPELELFASQWLEETGEDE